MFCHWLIRICAFIVAFAQLSTQMNWLTVLILCIFFSSFSVSYRKFSFILLFFSFSLSPSPDICIRQWINPNYLIFNSHVIKIFNRKECGVDVGLELAFMLLDLAVNCLHRYIKRFHKINRLCFSFVFEMKCKSQQNTKKTTTTTFDN